MLVHFFSPLRRLRLWRIRRVAGALMVKAAYEPLEDSERFLLESLCKKTPELAAEQKRYTSFTENFCLPSEELPFDLSKRIAASLEEDSPKRRSWARVYVTVTAVAVLAVGLNFGYMYLDGTSTIGAPEQFSHIAAAAHPSSPENELALLVGGVSDDMLPEDITAQVALIEAAIASNPDMYNAGEALCRIAGLEFHCLQRYGKAFSNYKQLHTEYPQLFDDCQECAARYNLLEEVRSEDYGPLYSLDLARNENSFTAFENIVADYPNTVLADAAVDEMRLLVQTARDDRGTNMADDLELVREQCSSPIAMAQVDLTLGHHYCNILNDRERAEACYKRVSAGGHISLAHQAHQALSEMD